VAPGTRAQSFLFSKHAHLPLLISSTHTQAMSLKAPDFVDLGVAAFTSSTDEGLIYSVKEPLTWEALFRLLREDRHREHLTTLLHHALNNMAGWASASEKGNRAEHAITLLLWYMIEPGKHLRQLVLQTMTMNKIRLTLPAWCAYVLESPQRAG